MAWQGGGHASRPGLSSRTGGEGQVQIHIGDKGSDFDAQVDGLRTHVGRIKELSRAIRQEQEEQGEMISTLDDTMERAKYALQRAGKKLNQAFRQSKSNHLLYLVIFALALFFGVYMLARMYRLKKGLLG